MLSLRLTNLVIIILSQFLGAYYLLEINLEDTSQSFRLLFLMACSVLSAISGNLINDFFDWEIDLINKKRKWKGEQLTLRKVAVGVSVCSMIFAVFLSVKVFILVGLNQALLYLYSRNFKGLPFLGNVVIAFLSSTVILILGFEFGLKPSLISFAAFAFISTLLRELIKDVEDIEGDTALNLRTIPIVLGPKMTKMVLFILGALLFILPWLFFLATQEKSYLISYRSQSREQ